MSFFHARSGLSGLGLSLKPPKWLRKLINTPVTVPTETGPIVVTPGDVLASTRTGPTPMQQAAANVGRNVTGWVDQVPGGWLTVGGGAALAAWLLLGRRRRRT